MAYFISYKKLDGFKNMETDKALLDIAIEKQLDPILRFYGWSQPTLSLGRNQSLKNINTEYCANNNIDIVKRPTGGRALIHDKELTYSFITPVNFLSRGSSVIESYREISEALILGFKNLHLDLKFPEYKKISVKDGYCMALSTGTDLSYNGKKLIGSAQFRKQGYILQHGSILIDIDENLLLKIFNFKENFSNVITLSQIKPELGNIDVLAKAVKAGFREKFLFDFNPFPF